MRKVVPLFCTFWIAGWVSAAQPTAVDHAWTPAVGTALAQYRAGEYELVRGFCTRVLADPSVPSAVQRDAAALLAMCLLRSDSRRERVEGQARLADLAKVDPVVAADPECYLAYGIALRAQYETADALIALERAVAGFATRDHTERQLAALVELARTWCVHAEWERTPAGLGVPRNVRGEAAEQARRNRFEAVRERIEALPNHDVALLSADLAWAEYLLEIGAGEGGESLLAQIANNQPLSLPVVQAQMQLAARLTNQGANRRAYELYVRVADRWQGELAREAQEAADRLTRPELTIDIPPGVSAGTRLDLVVRARGMKNLRVEVRSAELDQWLNSPRSRGRDALLPTSGSIQLSRDFSISTNDELDAWSSREADPPLVWTATPGAYVVIVRGVDRDGRTQVRKQLMTVSDFVALACVGPEQVLVWVTPAPNTPTSISDAPRVKFWMQGSYVPVEPKCIDGVAAFELPSEAHVMRSRQWLCWVQWASHCALLRGELPVLTPAERLSPLVVTAGPETVEPDQELRIAGWLLPRSDEPGSTSSLQPLNLEQTDSLGRPLRTQRVSLSSSGAFTTRLDPHAMELDSHLRVEFSANELARPNLTGRVVAQCASSSRPNVQLACVAPARASADARTFSVDVRGRYSWGGVPQGLPVRAAIEALPLPNRGAPADTPWRRRWTETGRLDTDGLFSVDIDQDRLNNHLPCLVTANTTLTAWDGSTISSTTNTLVAAESRHIWLIPDRPAPQLGETLRFLAGWRPQDIPRTVSSIHLNIWRAEERIARLAVVPTYTGLQSEPWCPSVAGAHELELVAELLDGTLLKHRQPLHVMPAGDPIRHQIMCTARLESEPDRSFVSVRLVGDHPGPLFITAEAANPLAAIQLPRLEHAADVELSLPGGGGIGLHVGVYGADRQGIAQLARVPVRPAQRPALRVGVRDDHPAYWPGEMAQIHLCCEGLSAAEQGALLVRLVNADTAQRAKWPPTIDIASPAPICTTDNGQTWHPPDTLPRHQSPDGQDVVWSQLLAGETLWCTAGSTTELTELSVPLPAAPGVYWLLVGLRAANGAVAVTQHTFDTRSGIEVRITVPGAAILGDRPRYLVECVNHGPKPTTVDVHLSGAGGVSVESIESASADGLTGSSAPTLGGKLTLTAGQIARITGVFEARAVGAGRLVVQLSDQHHRVRHDHACVVRASQPPARRPLVGELSREVWVWSPPIEWVYPDQDPSWLPPTEWPRARWTPGQRLNVGEVLEVREVLALPAGLDRVLWVQPVPATCSPLAESLGDLPGTRIGTPQPAHPGTLAYAVPDLAAGRHTHVWYLVASWPGVATLPGSRLRTSETTVLTTDEAAEITLIVEDSP